MVEKTLGSSCGKKTIEVLEKFDYVKGQELGVRSQNPGARISKKSKLKIFPCYQHFNSKMRPNFRGFIFCILTPDSWLLSLTFLCLIRFK